MQLSDTFCRTNPTNAHIFMCFPVNECLFRFEFANYLVSIFLEQLYLLMELALVASIFIEILHPPSWGIANCFFYCRSIDCEHPQPFPLEQIIHFRADDFPGRKPGRGFTALDPDG